jgi:hypothetical protein
MEAIAKHGDVILKSTWQTEERLSRLVGEGGRWDRKTYLESMPAFEIGCQLREGSSTAATARFG